MQTNNLAAKQQQMRDRREAKARKAATLRQRKHRQQEAKRVLTSPLPDLDTVEGWQQLFDQDRPAINGLKFDPSRTKPPRTSGTGSLSNPLSSPARFQPPRNPIKTYRAATPEAHPIRTIKPHVGLGGLSMPQPSSFVSSN